MQPEVQAALAAAVAGLVVALISGVVAITSARMTSNAKVILLEVKAELAEFKGTFVETLNGRYIRKPELPEDWPMSRIEGRAIEKSLDLTKEVFEVYRKDVHARFDGLHREFNMRKP